MLYAILIICEELHSVSKQTCVSGRSSKEEPLLPLDNLSHELVLHLRCDVW